ncbi:hypothetical protein [Seohaeicola zhoushanensis]|uniref:Flagellar protein FliL n=1 Tax=Seohaeicola zhoushanensis TaxID=1569283 RepID=A0A8J3M423_9RHOB|nr:hypothetical protein [Seohaeicola zhoushanensis]GHF36208.1 hypothetical protein GCM10017056_05020 [Seohaeicola zhoushanensis]
MKMLLIAAAVVPVLSLGAGYGIGTTMGGKAEKHEAAVTNQSKDGEKEAKALIEAAEAKAKAEAGHAEDDGHAARAETPSAHEAKPAHGEPHAKADDKPKKRSKEVVNLGQVTVPIYKPMSVTYVVADLGVAMSSAERAAQFRIAENATRLRDNIMESFREATENPKMRRAALDSDWLSRQLTQNLRAEFEDAEEVIFLNLFKKDVPRS